MGWCRGSYMADEIWCITKEYLPEGKKIIFAKHLYKMFSDEDADCWDQNLTIVQFLIHNDPDIAKEYNDI